MIDSPYYVTQGFRSVNPERYDLPQGDECSIERRELLFGDSGCGLRGVLRQ